MKALFEMPGVVVNVKTQEEFSEYMEMCAKVGWEWNDGCYPSFSDGIYFNDYEELTCIDIKKNIST